ncbi:MAG: hypothetical protein AB7P46_14915, partial [Thermoanaerobaculia bacterium]
MQSNRAVPLLLLAVVFSPPLGAVCDSTIFHDSFESGDTSAWANSPAPARADGTWRFVVDFAGSARAFSLELVQRPDGRLLGYLLGATRFRSMVEGTVAGPAIQFQLELRNPGTTRSVIFAGTFDRTSMNLTASGDVAAQPVVAQRLRCEL